MSSGKLFALNGMIRQVTANDVRGIPNSSINETLFLLRTYTDMIIMEQDRRRTLEDARIQREATSAAEIKENLAELAYLRDEYGV